MYLNLFIKRYSLHQIIGTILITLGICIFISASANNLQKTANKESSSKEKIMPDFNGLYNLFIMFIGVLLLVIALVLSAVTGLYQEMLYSKFGRQSREALFYSHILPLPGFLFVYKDIINHANIMNKSEMVWLIKELISIPKMWIYLMGNVITQYICIRSVFWMTSVYPSITVTLVLTIRKFVNLILSIYYFQAPFTVFNAFGTLLVFYGTCIFYNLLRIPKCVKSLVSVESRQD